MNVTVNNQGNVLEQALEADVGMKSNQMYTKLLRLSRKSVWGNWQWSANIKVGDIGKIDVQTGEFTKYGELENFEVDYVIAPVKEEVYSAQVKTSSVEVEFKGGYDDPTTKTKVDVGTKTTWSTKSDLTLYEVGSRVGQTQLKDAAKAINANFQKIADLAKDMGYGDGSGGVEQGFCVVTFTNDMGGGVHFLAREKNTDLSITGSVKGMSVLTGGGTVTAGVDASYKDVEQTKDVQKFLWPSRSDQAASRTLPNYFSLLSFQGKLLLPDWTEQIPNWKVRFENNHGGTYIAHVAVVYQVDGKEKKTSSVSISGGRTHTFDLPVNAVKIQCSVSYTASKHHSSLQLIADPRGSNIMSGNTATVEIHGVWPWGPSEKFKLPKLYTAESVAHSVTANDPSLLVEQEMA